MYEYTLSRNAFYLILALAIFIFLLSYSLLQESKSSNQQLTDPLAEDKEPEMNQNVNGFEEIN